MLHQSQRNVNDVVRYKQNWRETSRALYLHRMTSPEVAIVLYFFAKPRFKPIGEGGNFHSCNKAFYFLKVMAVEDEGIPALQKIQEDKIFWNLKHFHHIMSHQNPGIV